MHGPFVSCLLHVFKIYILNRVTHLCNFQEIPVYHAGRSVGSFFSLRIISKRWRRVPACLLLPGRALCLRPTMMPMLPGSGCWRNTLGKMEEIARVVDGFDVLKAWQIRAVVGL